MLSGGSNASVSVTCAATTVTVQSSPNVKSTFGLSVNVVVGLALVVNVCEPEVALAMAKLEPLAFAASRELMVTFVVAALGGGSLLSLSLTCAASTVAVHSSPLPKSVFGSTVHVVGPPLTVTVCAPVLAQLTVTELLVIVTGSLNVTLRFVFVATVTEPLVGVTAVTDGAASMVKLKT